MEKRTPATTAVQESPSFYAHLVEVGRKTVGVVAAVSEGYQFFAFETGFSALEDRIFPSAENARHAASAFSRAAVPSSSKPVSLAAH